jgi:hypothetical protein
LERGLIFLSLVGLWWHDLSSSVVGFIILAGVYISQTIRRRRHEREYKAAVVAGPAAAEVTDPKD